MFESIIAQFGALLGFASLVSLIINIGKVLGFVKDGTADKWVAGINFVGLMALAVVNIFIPNFDPLPVDNILGQLAVVGSYIFSFVMMLLGSKLTYIAVKGLPVIGKSNTTGVG